MTKREPIKNIKTRRKITTWIDSSLYEEIRRAARLRNISQQNVLEGSLQGAFSNEEQRGREDLLCRRMDRLDQKFKVLERKLEIIAEINVLYFRSFLALTQHIPEDRRQELEAKTQLQFEKYLDELLKKMQTGQGVLTEAFNKSF